MTFGFADASYLAGILAASVTKTKKIATLGGTALPPVVESFRAFEQGARAIPIPPCTSSRRMSAIGTTSAREKSRHSRKSLRAPT